MTATDPAREHLLRFLRALNEAGIAAPAFKQADFLLALTRSPPEHIDALYWRARVTLTAGVADFAAFDAVFDAFFRGGRLVVEEPAPPPRDAEGDTAAPTAGDEGELLALEPRAGSGLHASPLEARGSRSFAPASKAERDTLREIGAAIPAALPATRARRSARVRRGVSLDLQRVLRKANRTGGEVLELAWRRRPPRPRPVLLFVDVSGSLRAHSADLLRFSHEIVRGTGRAEVFTFGTRLTRVTSELDTPDVDRALRSLSRTVLDADGGTRIGMALQQFLAEPRLIALARGAVIIVMSDGLERGDPAAMGEATRRLGRLGHRLVWWSPLACDPAYRPVTRGIALVLDDLDALSGARDLPTLLRELRVLAALEARPRRMAGREWASQPAVS
jgi:uncharacterized protein with von Willebrand factor type A (vWA) domain